MTTANVYQQRPTTGAKAESSLHHADLASLVGKGRKNAGVIVREKKLLGHLTIRGDGHDAAFAAGVHKALGIELPGLRMQEHPFESPAAKFDLTFTLVEEREGISGGLR